MINFYQRLTFILETPKILNNLLKGLKNVLIEWSTQAEDAENYNNVSASSTWRIDQPRVRHIFFAMGEVLRQRVNYIWGPLGLLTKLLSPAQRKYSAYDRELLAMYTAVKQFRHTVEGRNL
jgi:hypothetical protein